MKKSTTTSQLIKSKQPSVEEKRMKKKNVTSLKDIESVLNSLELDSSNIDITTTGSRVCNCMARRHPLFEIAPNCLNCGKIICVKEGLQPCSFCGSSIISNRDKTEIVKLLEKEKSDIINSENHPAIAQPKSQTKQKKIVVKMNPGEKFWEAQDRAFKLAEEESKKKKLEQEQEKEQLKETIVVLQKDVESDADLTKAQERLNTLLHYQDTGEERTKIIDNASDFEFPNQSIWLSPEERALNLKKQQRLSREQNLEKERSRRGEKTVEMSITKDGKVKMIERYVPVKESKSNDEIKIEEDIKTKKQLQQNHITSIWNYEEEANKWEKPIYFTTEEKVTNSNSSATQTRHRVQFDKAEESELIATFIN